MNQTNLYLNITDGSATTNSLVFMPITPGNAALSNIWIGPAIFTNIAPEAQTRIITKTVTVTNCVTMAASPFPIHMPAPTTMIGAVLCLLCVWRLWWLRKVDKRIKAAREAAYDQFLALKHPALRL